MSHSVFIAGSTERTKLCAVALAKDARFTIAGVLTPVPKPIGRKQVITKNALHAWAEKNKIPVTLIEKKIDEKIRAQVETQKRPDFLLVVDFGYIVPTWLLRWPTIAPVNIHPSALPKYRGSSPGQFVLMAGETESAVSFIVMDEKLDHGPVIDCLPFQVLDSWTATEYYEQAFSLAQEKIGDILAHFAKDQKAVAQPDESPTPTARMLSREDGFITFQTLKDTLENGTGVLELYNHWRGLTPWPGLWTKVSISGQEKRMKLLKFHVMSEKLLLDDVQIEGKNPQSFKLVRGQLDD